MANKRSLRGNITEQQAVDILRKNWGRLIEADGVSSCGVGYELDLDGQTTRVCIQCVVARKYSRAQLRQKDLKPLPEFVEGDDGVWVKVDVIERRDNVCLGVSGEETEDVSVASHELWRKRMDSIRPGADVAHPDVSAGTIGALA